MNFKITYVPSLRALCGIAMLVAAGAFPAAAQNAAQSDEARAATLREEIPSLPTLVRATPNIYVVRIEKIDSLPDDIRRPVRPDATTMPESDIRASVLTTVKGETRKTLTFPVRQRRAGAAAAGLYGGDVSGDPDQFQRSIAFFSTDRFLSPRNPMFGGPKFKEGELYLLFMDAAGTSLLGGPYGYQPIRSENSFWVQTVKDMVAHPDRAHAISMSFAEFARKHDAVFVMVVGDCLGTEVSLSEPIWGKAVTREEIDPARILPESAQDCAESLEEKRGYLGLFEARPWLYEMRRGYPNQSYVEIRDGMLDFSELGLDIGFPDEGRISVADFAERMSGGSTR